MSIAIDDAAPQWAYFLASDSSCSLSKEETGWNQLADNATADTNELWNGTETWTSTTGASMLLAFQGTQLFLYSTVSPDGGDMSVIIDNITTTVSLYSPEVLYGTRIFLAEGLDPDMMHAMSITMLNGTKVNIDRVNIQPPPPNAFPPAWPQFQLAVLPNTTGIQLTPCSTPTTTLTPMIMMTTTTSQMTASTVIKTEYVTQPVKNSGGQIAGVIVGTGLAVAIVVIMGFLARRYFHKRRAVDIGRQGSRRSGPGQLRQLLSGSRISRTSSTSSQRHSRLPSSDSTRSFGNDRPETLLEDVEEKPTDVEKGSTEFEELPSIRHPSTIDMGSLFSRSTTPTPFAILGQLPNLPAPLRAQSPSSQLNNNVLMSDTARAETHSRSRGLPLSLSINTNINSVRASTDTRTRTSGWSTDEEVRNRTSRALSVAGPSRIGQDHAERPLQPELVESSQENGVRPSRVASLFAGSDRDAAETAEFYAAYARAGFLQDDPEEYEDIDDDPDEIGDGNEIDAVDTPLIPPSPAIASSNASVAHGSASIYSFMSSEKRGSKASKILRSLRSRSSMRHPPKRRSTQSSATTPKSPDSSSRMPKTPVSMRASVSSRSRKSSVPSLPEHSPSLAEAPAVPRTTADPQNADVAVTASPVLGVGVTAAPSAWTEAKKHMLTRPYRPPAFGPRAKNGASSGIIDHVVSGSASKGRISPTLDTDMLGVVQENSALNGDRSTHDQDLF